LTQKQRRATLAKAAEARQQEKYSGGDLRQNQNFIIYFQLSKINMLI